MNEIRGVENIGIKPIAPIEKINKLKREKSREYTPDSKKQPIKKEDKGEDNGEVKNRIDIVA